MEDDLKVALSKIKPIFERIIKIRLQEILLQMHHEGVIKLGPLKLFFEFCYEEMHCINTNNIVILSIRMLPKDKKNILNILRRIT